MFIEDERRAAADPETGRLAVVPPVIPCDVPERCRPAVDARLMVVALDKFHTEATFGAEIIPLATLVP
jgi:hypothetical protein